MSEWLKEHAWKACVGETLPRVRIPLSPPSSLANARSMAFRAVFRPARGSRRDSARIPQPLQNFAPLRLAERAVFRPPRHLRLRRSWRLGSNPSLTRLASLDANPRLSSPLLGTNFGGSAPPE